MRRLFGILFINAWGGLRRTINLLAVATVVLGVTALIVVGNMDAGALSRSAKSAKHTAADITRKAATSSPLAMLSGNVPTPKKQSDPNEQVETKQNVATTAPKSSSSNTTQNNTQTVVITPGQMFACAQSQSGQTLYTMQSAQLNLSNPTTSSGTVSWFWEIQATSDNTTATTQQTGASQNEIVAAGSSVIIVPGDNSQALLNFTGDGTSTYQFRLHIVGAVNATSGWISAPQTAATSCQ